MSFGFFKYFVLARDFLIFNSIAYYKQEDNWRFSQGRKQLWHVLESLGVVFLGVFCINEAIINLNRSDMRDKIQIHNLGGNKTKIKVRYLVVALGVLLSGLVMRRTVQAAECPDIQIIFARGSGAEQNISGDYLEFKATIEEKIHDTGLSYSFMDLEYPAVGVGFGNIDTAMTTLGAFFGGGESYKFGKSMWKGVEKLQAILTDTSCPQTKYVLGGYSQGAMVLLNSLSYLTPERLIYMATFGDPKIYLPEGEGIIPAACHGENLSDYRMYVPDCQAYKGILGAYIPYEPEAYIGKIGTWCNKGDILCSSHYNIGDHTRYVSEGLYEDASRVIYDKICKAFGIKNTISSPHDTAILIDSTGSMESLIEQYKAEALRLAKETLESGGRVALYDYRDLNDPYSPVQHCDFNSCTVELVQSELDGIQVDGGGDDAESLLSASFHVMRNLEWKKGSTKSLVVLTDADFLSPDRDGMSFDEVVALSKRIDPVNFYIVTTAEHGDDYMGLAAATDGRVVTNFDELSLLTDYILERYDSLPRVEEEPSIELPSLVVDEVIASTNEATIKFHSNGSRTIVALNDGILGVTSETEFTISGLRDGVENRLTLIPLGDGVRGEPVEVLLNKSTGFGNDLIVNTVPIEKNQVVIPKAPNTGRR